MKDQPQQHLHSQAAPTVIHDYQADETVLARWLRRGMAKGPTFWLLLVGAVALAVAVMLVFNAWANTRSEASQAWLEMMVPSIVPEPAGEASKDLPEDVRPLMKVAEDHPGTPAAEWALYQAACHLYEEGLRDLPANREAARPILNQSYELFERLSRSADADGPIRRLARMGMARCLETRNELSEAREQYLQVASDWPDTDLARRARERAEKLADPAVKAFYENFYTQDFTRFTGSPGLVPEGLGLPPGHPPLDAPASPSGLPSALDSDFPTAPIIPPASDTPATPGGLPALPSDLFPPAPPSPTPTPDTAGEPAAPSGDTPTETSPAPAAPPDAAPASGTPATPGELPAEPFAPAGEAPKG